MRSKSVLRLASERLGLDVAGRRHDVRDPLDARAEVRRGLGELHHAEPLQPLDDQADRPVGLLEHPVDGRDRPRPVKVLGRRRLLRGVELRQDADRAVAEDGLVHRANGGRPRDRQRDDRLREQHGLPERQDGELVRLARVGPRGGAGPGAAGLVSIRISISLMTFSSGSPRVPGAARLRAGLIALPYFLAPRAADREGMGPQPGRSDLLLARLAASVAPFVHLLQGQIDLSEHARPPIGHREPHLVVGRQRRAVAERHALDLLAARRRLDASLALFSQLGHELGALLEEQRLQLRLDGGGSLARS